MPRITRSTEIKRERGYSKTKCFNGKYQATKWEFPEGWGIQTNKPSMGGTWKPSRTTQSG